MSASKSIRKQIEEFEDDMEAIRKEYEKLTAPEIAREIYRLQKELTKRIKSGSPKAPK